MIGEFSPRGQEGPSAARKVLELRQNLAKCSHPYFTVLDPHLDCEQRDNRFVDVENVRPGERLSRDSD